MDKSYGQLSLTERIEIYRLHAGGKSVRFIAKAMERNAATISRELRRNGRPSRYWRDGYDAVRAQELSRRRRSRGRSYKLERQPELRKLVFDQLAMDRSPEQIAGRLALEQGKPVISFESIYRYIYWRNRSFKENLHRLLPRQKRARGRPGRQRGGSLAERIKQRVSIAKRPKSVDARQQPGHWEADTIAFSKQDRHVLILLERRSRRIVLRPQSTKLSTVTAAVMEDILTRLPAAQRKSVTMDNGPEFSKHYLLREAHGIKTWFCDPKAPWQKGSVENSVGRLRRFLPRKTDSKTLTIAKVAQIMERANNTPRKCLGFLTPDEVFFNKKPSVALQT